GGAGTFPASSGFGFISLGIAAVPAFVESCGVWLRALGVPAFRSGAAIASAIFTTAGEGTGAGLGGVYCSIITGVAMLSVGSLRSLAVTDESSIESGSSC